ncbi:MAG: hypothetical protein JO268_03090 [Pseudonocardiales bacterium]|nr:hypothetical protein [Pseudonocardiales bacterium]
MDGLLVGRGDEAWLSTVEAVGEVLVERPDARIDGTALDLTHPAQHCLPFCPVFPLAVFQECCAYTRAHE